MQLTVDCTDIAGSVTPKSDVGALPTLGAMTRSRVLLAPAASLAAVLALSACVPVEGADPYADFAASDDARQLELLREAEDAVAAVILDPPTAADAMNASGVDTRQLVFRDLGSIAEGMADIIGSGQLVDEFDGQVAWSDGRQVLWQSPDAGAVTGTYTSEGGGASSESSFTLNICPDASGRFSGHAKVEGDAGGVGWDVVFNFSGTVGDDAWADEMVVEAAGTLDAAGIQQDTNTTVSFGFGERGTRGVTGDGTSGVVDGTWDRAVDDFASKASLRLARIIEDNWRSGRCVRVDADPMPASVAPGGELDFAVVHVSKVDGVAFDEGSLEAFVIEGEGSIGPEGQQMTGTPFTYAAPDEEGTATVQFLSVSRRGVGLVEVPITIGGGWTFTQTYTDITSSATKCGALTGSWEMASTASWDYVATTTWTFDESLRATATTSGTAGGQAFSGTKEVWLVETGPGEYELHASDGPNVFYLEPAPAGACP